MTQNNFWSGASRHYTSACTQHVNIFGCSNCYSKQGERFRCYFSTSYYFLQMSKCWNQFCLSHLLWFSNWACCLRYGHWICKKIPNTPKQRSRCISQSAFIGWEKESNFHGSGSITCTGNSGKSATLWNFYPSIWTILCWYPATCYPLRRWNLSSL